MSAYLGNIMIKNPATPTGPAENDVASGIWTMNEALAFKRRGIWPTQGVQGRDPYFSYVSLLLSTTSLGNANNNLFVDSSGAFNPVSRLGNTTQGSATPYGANWSNYLDNSGDYLTTGAGSSAFAFGTGNFTIEAWFFANGAVSNWKPMLSVGAGAQGQLIRINQGLQFTGNWGMLYPNDAGNTDVYFDTGSPFPLNQWVHVALVRNGTTLTLYQNGVNVLQKTVGFNFTNTTGVAIGYGQYSGDGVFGGYISNVRIVKGTAVYTGNFTPSTTPLTAISGTSLLTCQSNRFRDASTNNFTVTPVGDTRVTDFSPFSPGSPGITYNQNDITNWSGYFDGVTDYLSTPANAVFGYGTGDFTIEFWMYLTGTPDQTIVSNLASASGTSPHIYYSAGTIRYYTASADRITSGSIVVGQWYHVAVSRASGSTRMFVNGVQAGSTYADTNNYGSTAPFAIATYWNGGSPVTTNTFTGYLSNVRIVKGTALYTSSFTPPTTNLTAVSGTSVLTCQSAAFADNSTNSLVLTQGGNPTVTGNSPFGPTGYWSLNGSSAQGATIPQTTATDLGSGSFTIECWVNAQAFNTFVTKRRTDTALGGSWMLSADASGYFYFLGVGWGSTYAATTNPIPLNKWTHLAVSRSGTNLSMFVNGVRVYNVTDSYDYTCSTYTIIKLGGNEGGNYPSGNSLKYGFTGSISNLRIVQGTAIYNPASTSFTVPTAPLTAVSGTSLLTLQDGTLKDNSTNNNTSIAIYGGASIQPFNPFYTSTITSNGGSMYFDGNGDYLVVPYNSTLDILSGDFTVETWVYPTANSGFRPFFGQWYQVSGGGGFIVGSNGANFNFNFGPFSTGAAMITASTTFAINAWYHIAVVRSGSNFTMYVNGVSVGTATSSATLAPINVNITMGNYYSPSGTFPATGATDFAGYLSGTRITKSAVYSSAFTPPTAPAPPTGSTTLLVNGMNAGIYDATAVNDMETAGNAQVTTAVSKFGGSSVAFDGSGDYVSIPSNNEITLGSGDFTIEFWLYLNSNSIVQILYDQRNGNGAYPVIYMPDASIRYYVNTADRIIGANLNTATWYHIAICRSGTSTRMFINGTQSGSTYTDTTNYLAAPLFLGADKGPANFMNGYMDDVRITKGYARYTSNFTPPTQAFPTY